ncbi:coiled-coil domain-containing protein 34 isoform X3 [Pangasianodon hypophthalmus]|uniref:coiled-coil domain-containing protein 34 isoform X3 n=1 Tax=Pangasianodon hypophthalmus TaxID=310915 RepID=UPI00147AAA59|nr:coiled-coil domain-containing protein 34 isoform X3 [Pangasianodon hypophthalmus]
MSVPQSASSKSLTSTPLKSKSAVPRSIPRSRSVESTGDSTYSLLSPIYHDSFELSDDDKEEAQNQCQPPDDPSLAAHEGVLPIGPSRNESLHAEDTSTGKLNLSAWEQWLVSKAKEERIKIHQKSLQEKQEKLCRESQKTNKMLHEEQKRLEIEKKAQEKYNAWLHKKKQEEKERKLKEQEEIARREKEEREQKERADEKFKEWLKNITDKERHKRKSSACSADGYDNLNYPAPSFVNPIPWKPIHIPQQDRTPRKNSAHRKQPGPPKNCSTPCLTYKPKDTISFASKRL